MRACHHPARKYMVPVAKAVARILLRSHFGQFSAVQRKMFEIVVSILQLNAPQAIFSQDMRQNCLFA